MRVRFPTLHLLGITEGSPRCGAYFHWQLMPPRATSPKKLYIRVETWEAQLPQRTFWDKKTFVFVPKTEEFV